MKTYLITSESYKLLDEELQKIIPASSNVIKYDLRTSSINEIINEAGYFSLMAEIKYIIVKSGELFKAGKKEDSESNDLKILESYLKNPNPNTIIIFTSSESPDKRKKVFKMINESGGYIEVPSFNKKDLCYKCMDILKKEGYKVDYDTATFIVDNSYVNYDIMTFEIEKIKTLLKPGNVDIKDLKNVISLSVSNKTFSYINAIVDRDLKTALNAISSFEKLKIDPIVVVIMLAKEMQIYLNLKRNIDAKEIQKLYGKEDWMMKNYLQNVSKYTEKELKKIIITLNNYDYGLKSGTLDKSVALDLLALELCA